MKGTALRIFLVGLGSSFIGILVLFFSLNRMGRIAYTRCDWDYDAGWGVKVP